MSDIPEPVAVQTWSHAGLTPEMKAQYDAILNYGPSDIPKQDDGSLEWQLSEPRETPEKNSAQIEPWQNKAESVGEIKRLSARLKQFCTAPAYIAVIRSILKDAKVIGNVPRHYSKRIRKGIRKPKG